MKGGEEGKVRKRKVGDGERRGEAGRGRERKGEIDSRIGDAWINRG